jgi:hypothetical protein
VQTAESGTIRPGTPLASRRTIVGKRKHTKRGHHYETMAVGFQILKSPLAVTYSAAAEHYTENDPPLDLPKGSDALAAGKLEQATGRD